MEKRYLFRKIRTYTNSKGVKVTEYEPLPDVDIKVLAIDVETGNIAWKKVLLYTKHEGLTMYRIYIKDEDYEFWVSDDHSLIVCDIETDTLMKATPEEYIQNKSYRLVKAKSVDNTDEGYTLIDRDNVIVEQDPNVTVGYDFTVEDYATFCLSNGIFVQDTMAVFVPLTKEAQEEAVKKILSNVASPAGIGVSQLALKNDVITGIYLLTKEPSKAKSSV